MFRAHSTPTRSPSKQPWKRQSQLKFPRPTRTGMFILILSGLLIWTISRNPTILSNTTNPDIFAPLSKSIGPPRVALITFTTEQKSYTHLSLKNHQNYANLQGFDFLVDYEAPHNLRGAMWHKFTMIERAIASGKYDWIWWLDFDTLITNATISVAQVIEYALEEVGDAGKDQINFIFTSDCFALNAGSFLTRSTPRSLPFFTAVRAHHDHHATSNNQLSEQDCMRDVIFPTSTSSSSYSPVVFKPEGPLTGPFAHQITFAPQWMMNAFPKEIPCVDDAERYWERGMLVVHFAGAWAHVKATADQDGDEDAAGLLMRKYEGSIDWGRRVED